jgi:hypothetical protein
MAIIACYPSRRFPRSVSVFECCCVEGACEHGLYETSEDAACSAWHVLALLYSYKLIVVARIQLHLHDWMQEAASTLMALCTFM